MKSKVPLLCKTDRVMHLEFLHLEEMGHGDKMKCKTNFIYNDNYNSEHWITIHEQAA